MNGSVSKSNEPPTREEKERGGVPCDVLNMLVKLSVPCVAISQIAPHAQKGCLLESFCAVKPK